MRASVPYRPPAETNSGICAERLRDEVTQLEVALIARGDLSPDWESRYRSAPDDWRVRIQRRHEDSK